MGFVTLNGGHIKADESFVEALVALKFDTMPGVFSYAGEGYLRTHAKHDNFHIVKTIGSRAYDLFLKRHEGLEVKESLKFLMARDPFASPGRREWDNIQRLESLGIATMPPVAYGEDRGVPLLRRSFLVTRRIPSAVPMDDYMKEHFAVCTSGAALREKRALLWDLGGLVRKLHSAGLTHMDLYLNHVFVKGAPGKDKVLHLIDLQRVARRWIFKRRWIVKDLAAVIYSARHVPLSTTDLARVFTAYFDGAGALKDRSLIRAAIRRAARMMQR